MQKKGQRFLFFNSNFSLLVSITNWNFQNFISGAPHSAKPRSFYFLNIFHNLISLMHRHKIIDITIKKIDCLRFVMCPLLAPPHPRLFSFFHTAAICSTNVTNKPGGMCHWAVYFLMNKINRSKGLWLVLKIVDYFLYQKWYFDNYKSHILTERLRTLFYLIGFKVSLLKPEPS